MYENDKLYELLHSNITEAKYHYLVERTPLREESDAWKRAQDANIAIPEEMMQWVGDELQPSGEVAGNSEELKTIKA